MQGLLKEAIEVNIEYDYLAERISQKVMKNNNGLYKRSLEQLDQKIDSSVVELKQNIVNLDHKVDNLDQKFINLDQKFDSSVERLDQKIDNKYNTTHALLIGLVVVVVAQIIGQYFF